MKASLLNTAPTETCRVPSNDMVSVDILFCFQFMNLMQQAWFHVNQRAGHMWLMLLETILELQTTPLRDTLGVCFTAVCFSGWNFYVSPHLILYVSLQLYMSNALLSFWDMLHFNMSWSLLKQHVSTCSNFHISHCYVIYHVKGLFSARGLWHGALVSSGSCRGFHVLNSKLGMVVRSMEKNVASSGEARR